MCEKKNQGEKCARCGLWSARAGRIFVIDLDTVCLGLFAGDVASITSPESVFFNEVGRGTSTKGMVMRDVENEGVRSYLLGFQDRI